MYILILSQTIVKYLYTVCVYYGNKCFNISRFRNVSQQLYDPESCAVDLPQGGC